VGSVCGIYVFVAEESEVEVRKRVLALTVGKCRCLDSAPFGR